MALAADKDECCWLLGGEALAGQDGKGDDEIPIWKHFSMEWSHMQVLYCCYFLSYISQAIFRFGFYTTRLRFIEQIFFFLPKARNWVDFHSLHCQKNKILMDMFLASWWFNLTSIWLAHKLLNTFCSITRKMIMQSIHGQFLLAQAVFADSRPPLKLEPADYCLMGITCLWAGLS